MSLAPVSADRSRVHMNVEPGERLVFGDTGIEVELVGKSGRVARVCVITPRDVSIERSGDSGLDVRAKPATMRGTHTRG